MTAPIRARIADSEPDNRKGPVMALTTGDAEYERRYAADCRREAMIEDVAKALCDACYGAGAWERISRRPEGHGQVQGWMSQARAAVAVVERWTQ